jgi:uncharacterized protein (TIRG00374 family)
VTELTEEAVASSRRRWKIAGQVFLVILGALTLQVLAPALAVVYTSVGDVVNLNPLWLAFIISSEATSFVCMWYLMRLVIRTSAWRDVARAQLVGNAVSHVVPGGAATGAAVQMRMLTVSGVDRGAAVSGLPVVGLLTAATVLVSPVFALPALLAVPDVPRQLLVAAAMGLVGSVLLGGLLAVFLTTTGPLRAIASLAEKVWNRLFRHRQVANLADRLVTERDMIRDRLAENIVRASLAAAGNVGFDYLALLAALAAVRAHPEPGLVLLAFVVATFLGMIPITPGGLGFVEAGLTGTLIAAGIPAKSAAVATAVYRVASYLLPVIAGAGAYVWYRIDPGGPAPATADRLAAGEG